MRYRGRTHQSRTECLQIVRSWRFVTTRTPSATPGWSSAPFVTGLDGRFRHPAPFGPRSVVDADVIASEQVGEGEPGGGGPAADRAVGDQPAVAGSSGGEDLA